MLLCLGQSRLPIEEFKRENLKVTDIDKVASNGSPYLWIPPPNGKYKVNWDSVVDNINGCMGIGIIVRDLKGHMIAAKSLTIMKNLESVVAEALAVSYAVMFSKELGLQHIIFEGEALEVVNVLNFTSRSFSRLGQLVVDTQLI